MPHLVSTFLRNSSTSFEAQVASIKKATVRRPSPKPTADPRSSSTSSFRRGSSNQRAFSYASTLGDDVDDVPIVPPLASNARPGSASNMNSANSSSSRTSTTKTMTSLQRSSSAERREGQHAPEHHHRLSFGGLHFGRSSREVHVNPNLVISWKIESPPIVLYNEPESSTGALVSGLLFLTVKEEPVQMETFEATLSMHTTQKRPYTAHCHDCIHQYTKLHAWQLLHAPTTLAKGQHGFPFSVLLPGHLPASMDNQLVSIAYEFHAEATPKAGCGLPTKFDKVFDVKRSLPAPELPHHSVRIFPPTNIKASVHFPQVIYPIGQNTLSLRIDGVARLNDKVNTLEFWRLKKLTWRLEETTKTVAPACAKHLPPEGASDGSDSGSPRASTSSVRAPGASANANANANASTTTAPATEPSAAAATTAAAATGAPAARSEAAALAAVEPRPSPALIKKGSLRTDTRVIGEKTLLSGWKSNYNGVDDSCVEMEIDYMLGKQCKFSCDAKTRDGTVVTHQLMIEMVVSQEWAPASKPSMITQTGVGRILRMHFTDIVTERGGIGVSWDNEAPPIYQDVPPSPPSYIEEINTQEAITDIIEPLDGTRA